MRAVKHGFKNFDSILFAYCTCCFASDMKRYNSTEGENWLVPMLDNYTRW